MSHLTLTKRELYIKSIFLPQNRNPKKKYLSNDKVNEIIKSISEIGEGYGFIGDKKNKNLEKSSKREHKYDVWIAKEIKKNIGLLDHFNKFALIIDWAVQTKSNIFAYSFEESFVCQEIWHKEMFKKYDIKEIEAKEIDKNRIIYRFSDKNYFLYLLNPEDLEYEGKNMGNCVGGDTYKSKVRNGRSIILSLRDEHNKPHVTTEIDVENKKIFQQEGKAGTIINSKYKKLMIEFVLFMTNYTKFENNEMIYFLNLNNSN